MNSRTVWIVFALLAAVFVWIAAGRRATPPAAPDADALRACALAGRGGGPGPRQTDVPQGLGNFRLGDFTIEPLAGFAIEATVLGREDYRFDAGAALSPVDLALGWDRMGEPAVYRALDIDQSGRWYRYRWGAGGPPIEVAEIIRSSANMHMIPADPGVAAALARVRPEQRVRLRGWLVEARRADGWQWRSSLSREDSGGGSCELVVVCALE